jgi:hypothetical protein
MIGGTKAIKAIIGSAIVISSLIPPAYSQGWSNRKSAGPSGGPLVEKHPPVDEKAYKAALDRIPTPDQKYDPWGIARPAESAKGTKKSN